MLVPGIASAGRLAPPERILPDESDGPLDRDTFEKLRDILSPSLHKAVAPFLEDMPGYLAQLERAVDDDALITGIIALAHSLRLEVVAESVENEAQRNFPRTQSYDLMQGLLPERTAARGAVCPHHDDRRRPTHGVTPARGVRSNRAEKTGQPVVPARQ